MKTAIIYCRHSAEDKQEFSIPVQKEEIKKFAKKHDIVIIESFEDAGKSGLKSDREGFINLIDYSKKNRFDYVLVYDVTRWGRFQDTDESAYYEVLLKREGKEVVYIDRGFTNKDNQLLSSLTKAIDRYMAADYSRKLSEKVYLGSMKIASLGFSVGGKAPYGLKRLLLDSNKKPIRVLKDGERKSISNERVTFTLGEGKDVEIIKNIFNEFVNKKLSKKEIAYGLNKKGIKSPKKRLWNVGKIHNILINENYIGTKVYNKTTKKLKTPSRANPKDKWVRVENAFEGIIIKELFLKAQEMIYNLRVRYTEDQLIKELKIIYYEYKKINSNLINNWEDSACAGTYGRRFGSLYNAYIKVDYMPKRAFIFFTKREKQRLILIGHVIEKLNGDGHKVSYSDEFLQINGKKVLIIPSILRKRKENNYWTFYFETKDVDYVLCIGFRDKTSSEIVKYYLFPKEVIEENIISVNALKDDRYDGYAVQNLKNILAI